MTQISLMTDQQLRNAIAVARFKIEYGNGGKSERDKVVACAVELEKRRNDREAERDCDPLQEAWRDGHPMNFGDR